MSSESIPLARTFALLEEVRRQYEAHPYPAYPLLLPMRRQEAYASTAVFAARLLQEQGHRAALTEALHPRILIAGCGDTFPSLLARWEPPTHRLEAIDLSERNIKRAQKRLWLALIARPLAFYQGALENWSGLDQARYAHIDAYGVLHHSPNPAALLERLAGGLVPGGTLRLMVYNSPARLWIHHVQRALALLGLDRFSAADLESTRRILELLEKKVPSFRSKLAPLASSILRYDARLVDTFLHAREARLDFSYWWRALEKAGLSPYGLFDRYAELDDLPSPLHRMPRLEELEERAADGRFENNLEIFCVKWKASPSAPSPPQSAKKRLPWGLYRCGPPLFWSGFSETQSLPFFLRAELWQVFRRSLITVDPLYLDQALARVPLSSLQRLVRIGALWPSSFKDKERRSRVLERIHPMMEAPEKAHPVDLKGIPELMALLDKILQEKGLAARRLALVTARLEAAARAL